MALCLGVIAPGYGCMYREIGEFDSQSSSPNYSGGIFKHGRYFEYHNT
jgi:hypothetical protein